MNKRILWLAAVAPTAFVGYVAFHPGIVALAETKGFEPSGVVQSGTYAIDPMHTSISFEIGHLGLTKVHGRFNKFEGAVDYNAADPTKSTVNVTIQVASVDTAVAPRDEHLRTADYFDVAKFPEINFRSTAVRKTDKGMVADGVLTIKGNSKPVSIPFKLGGPVDIRGRQVIGVDAEAITIKRSNFGMQDGLQPGGLSDEVTIRLGVEAAKS